MGSVSHRRRRRGMMEPRQGWISRLPAPGMDLLVHGVVVDGQMRRPAGGRVSSRSSGGGGGANQESNAGGERGGRGGAGEMVGGASDRRSGPGSAGDGRGSGVWDSTFGILNNITQRNFGSNNK